MDSTPNQMDPGNSEYENLGFDLFCNTPTIDIEAPLSPVLSNSKLNVKYIARRKSRMRLLNKFSPSSTQSQVTTQKSHINFEPISSKSFLTPEQNHDLETLIINEYNSYISIETSQNDISGLVETTPINKNVIHDLEYLNITNNNACISDDTSLNETSDVESKMRKIKDIQLSKKFLYKIPQSETNIDLKSSNEFQFKIPVSPISSLKTKALNKENVFSKPKLNFEIGFKTGGGKRIQLTERALQRAVKIFDDILDVPSDNIKPELNSPVNLLKVAQNDLKSTENDFKPNILYPKDTSINNKIKNSFHNLNNTSETTNPNKIEETISNDLDGLISKTEIACLNVQHKPESSTSNINKDNMNEFENNLLCSKKLSESPINSKFTQISDTQMYWVAENTEHLMDCIDSQWTPSPQDKPLTVLDNKPEMVKSLKDDFDDLSTQETDSYFGNISLGSDGTQTTRTTDLEPFFLGFETDTSFKSLQTLKLYKQLIKYLTEDVKKKVFYPLSFTCSDIEHSMEYKKKDLKYSLRSRKNSFCQKKAQGIKKKHQKNVSNMKRRTFSLNDDSKEIILDRNKFKPNRSKTKCKKTVNISNTLKVNPVNETKNTINVFDTCDSQFDEKSSLVTLSNGQSTDESSNLSAPIFKNPCLGFSTASGLKIAISVGAVKKTKHLFDDCDFSENLPSETESLPPEPIFFTSTANSVSEDVLKNSRDIFIDPSQEQLSIIDRLTPEARFECLTASGKSLQIPEDALKRSMAIFEDKSTFGLSAASGENAQAEESTTYLFEALDESLQLEDALESVRNIFEQCDSSENSAGKIKTSASPLELFRASEESDHVMDESLKKVIENCEMANEDFDTAEANIEASVTPSQNLVNDMNEDLHLNNTLFQNFKVDFEDIIVVGKEVLLNSAAGNKITISEEALKNIRNTYDGCAENINTKSDGIVEFASENNVNIMEDSSNKANRFFEDSEKIEHNIIESCDIPKKLTFGFATASGKKVNISEDSMKKVKSLFDGCEITEEELKENCDTSRTVTNVGFATALGKKINISEDALKHVKSLFEDCEVTEKEINNLEIPKKVPKFEFATASGKKVNVSEDSMKKAKSLFEDCEVTEEEFTKNYDTPKNIAKHGFATASGKKVNISEDSLKKAKSLFEDCAVTEEELIKNYDTPKNIAKHGFATASGKKVNISEDSLKKAKSLFEDCEVTEEELTKNFDIPKNMSNFGFATASGKKVNISEDSLRKTKNIFEDCVVTEDELTRNFDIPKNLTNFGFATASGKKVNISEESLKKTKNLFEDCVVTEEELTKNFDTPKNVNLGFAAASGKDIIISEETLQKTKNIFEGCEVNEEKMYKDYEIPNNVANIGFATALGNKVNISEDSLKKAMNIFEDCELPSEETSCKFDTPKNYNISSASSSGKREILENSFKRSRNIFEEEPVSCEVRPLNKVHKFEDEVKPNSLPPKKVIPPFISPLLGSKSSPQLGESTPVLRNKSLNRSLKKRSLGVKSCRQLDIPETSIKRAKLVFEELDIPKKTYNSNNNQTSTPNLSTPVKVTPPTKIPQFNSSIRETKPVQTISPKIAIKQELLENNSPYSFHDPSNCDLKKLTVNFQKEYELLKLKMSVIENRMEILKTQQEVIDNPSPEHFRQRPGRLYLKKSQNRNRITMKELVKNRRPSTRYEKSLYMGVSPSILDINPENASQLHFFVPWWPNDHRSYPAIIRTEDGAIIVPNQDNQVGVSELDIAFRAMPGVEAKLIPNGWILNHYKWIVWKLASMERNFPDVFKDWLTIEHIVAQLKYRYDREIDKAQRPALRKIFECDDTPVKRMVLCVSKIIKHPDGKLELELTDGWYCVKTQLDPPLNSLVYRGIITVGMKLMTQGSELINCEGCPPLEVPESVRLRIHFNSTRRAAWHLKLGYQPHPGPLCISLRTINNNGGPVGLTCAYITRVYPISYMERLDERTVWRNRKAEQKRSNEWESKQSHILERVQQQVQQELEEEWNKKERESRKEKGRVKDIKGVTCPKALFEFVEASNDQDSIREMLTSSQYEAVQNYQVQLSDKRQAELSYRLQQRLSKENIKPRNVSSVFKILLLDVNSIYHNKILNIWRPTEEHLRDLKEGLVINIYNVTVRNNGQLSSIPRTQFVRDLDYDTEKFEPLDRTVLPISQTKISDSKPQFGEFDTVGMVISIDIQSNNQFLWMVDENFKFLVIKIRESPETCCLFDSLVEGKVIAAINLVYQKPSKYGEALANHYTIFSSYPQPSYLRDYMKDFVDSLPGDLETYVAECKDQIELFVARKQFSNNIFPCDAQSQEMRNELCGVSKDAMTLSDEEMSLIDTQAL